MSIKRDISERFWEKVNKTNYCWFWLGATNKAGYGVIGLNRSAKLAHRVLFQLIGQHLPQHLVIDHQCRNRRCVNPKHLRVVDRKINATENNTGWAAVNAQKTYCKRGHVLDRSNLVTGGKNGIRRCLPCSRILAKAGRSRAKITRDFQACVK